MALNKVMLQGRLTKKPELKQTKTGKQVCTFSVASDKRGKDAGTNFIDCVAWEKTAELLDKYFDKGSSILVEGRLDQQVWEQEGMKRSKIMLIADNIYFLGETKKEDSTPTEAEVDGLDVSKIPF